MHWFSDDIVVSNTWAREPISLERRLAKRKKMATEEEVRQIREQCKTMSDTMQTLSLQVQDYNKAQETIKSLQEQVAQLSKGSNSYEQVRRQIDVDPNILPNKFNTLDIPKFKANDNPLYHLNAFETIMTLKKIDKKLFPTLFPMSLEHTPQLWFCAQESRLTETWEGVCKLLLKRYEQNISPEHDLRELGLLKQKKGKGFTEFYGRWNTAMANMVKLPTERESVRKLIENLQEEYQQHMRFVGHSSFRSVYNVGIDIEDYLSKKSTGYGNNSDSSWKGKRNNDSPFSPKSTYSDNNGDANNVNDVWAIESSKESKKELTPIGMSYDVAFDRLFERGLIKPIGPTDDPVPEKRSSKWNPNSYCKYHRGNGHTTDECFRFQNFSRSY